MTLSYDERNSVCWRALKKHLEAELDQLRKHNDKDRDAIQTAWTRGEIAHIKAMLKLGEDPPETPAPSL